LSTYYVFPIRFLSEVAGLDRKQFVEALNAEGMQFYQGYTRPLYLQPVYQQRKLFKYGYPFSAPQNQGSIQEYQLGRCPVAEKLHYDEIIINEHIRLPHTQDDINQMIKAIGKLAK